jgi:hypothetical protein
MPQPNKLAPQMTGVNKLIDFVAQRLPANMFPTNARTLLETAQGNRDPITESNFSPEELDVIRQLILNQKQGSDAGSVKYPDYYDLAQRRRASGGMPVSSIMPGLMSMGDAFGNVQTTLGQFKYARDADGNLIVQDMYDFNPPQEGQTIDYAASGPYGLLRGYAGEKMPPSTGRPIKINLGR